MWADGAVGIVWVDGSRVVLTAADGTARGNELGAVDFSDAIVAFEVGSDGSFVYAAVQTCGVPADRTGDLSDACATGTNHELVRFDPGAVGSDPTRTDLDVDGDLARMFVNDRWIAVDIGQVIHVLDRDDLSLRRSITEAGPGACLLGDDLIARDASSVAAAPTTLPPGEPTAGRLSVTNVEDGERRDVGIGIEPSSISCGPMGAVIVGGNGLASQVWTLDNRREPQLLERVQGSAVLTGLPLLLNQLAVIETFVGGEAGGLLVDPALGVVRPSDSSTDWTTTKADQRYGQRSNYFNDGGSVTAVTPKDGGWAITVVS